MYAEAQCGNMVRYDCKSGKAIDIRPEPCNDEDTNKRNWNTPLMISRHSPTRHYTAANKVFHSHDRGDTCTMISNDLTTGTDRYTWAVIDKSWSIEAVPKDDST